MRYDLNNKIIMIAGANSGAGKAAAIQFAKCGQQWLWYVAREIQRALWDISVDMTGV